MSHSNISTAMCPDFVQEPKRFSMFLKELKETKPSMNRAQLMLAVVTEITRKIEDPTTMLPKTTVTATIGEILPILGLAEQFIEGPKCQALRSRIDTIHRKRGKYLVASPL